MVGGEMRHKLSHARGPLLVTGALLASLIVTGCASSPATTVSVSSATTVPAESTTTSQATTTSQPATTTTETRIGISPELVSTAKSLGDVNGSIVAPKPLTTPMNVPAELQKQFAVLHPGQKILYIGPHNQGDPTNLAANDMNDSLVTVGGPDGERPFLSYGGMGPRIVGQEGRYLQIAMEFQDIIFVPGSQDFYIRGTDPLNSDADIYVRVMVGAGTQSYPTTLLCFDLNSKAGFDYGSSQGFDKGAHYVTSVLKAHTFNEFAAPGDTLCIFARMTLGETTTTVINGQKVSGAPATLTVDERGCQEAEAIGVIRLMGADKVEALFKASGPYLGVQVQTVGQALQQQDKLSRSSGALVESVVPASPAAKAGIQKGDVVTAIDGAPVTRQEDIVVLLQEKAVGATISVTVDGKGKSLTLPVLLVERPGSATG